MKKLKDMDVNEDSEMWRQIRADSQKKRWGNLESSLRLMAQKGFKLQRLSDVHYRIGDWDFWPSTGKFFNRVTKQVGRGVFNLIKKL